MDVSYIAGEICHQCLCVYQNIRWREALFFLNICVLSEILTQHRYGMSILNKVDVRKVVLVPLVLISNKLLNFELVLSHV